MTQERIHIGDTGTIFRVTIKEEGVGVNLFEYNSVLFRFRKPDGTLLEGAADIENEGEGVVSYTTVAGDLDMTGRWWLELELDLPGWQGKTSKQSFFVHKNL